MLTVGSLFSGIGGIELGLERTGGFKTEWFVEYEPYAQAVLRKHWPEVPIYGDIRKINFKELKRVDVLTGGFPCQPHSVAGKRKASQDERDLWPEYLRAISEIKPRWVIAENVPGLRSSENGRFFGRILRDLAKEGYNAEWFDLRASDFGAPHKRERCIIIAYSKCNGYASSVSSRERVKQESKERGLQEFSRSYLPNLFADDWEERVQGFRKKSLQGGAGFSWCKDVRRVEDLRGRQDIPEPLFCGARDGVPYWVDRIKCCGNAVVPQCAEFIGEIILKREEQACQAKTQEYA